MVGAGAEDAKNQGFLRLESPIVRTSVNILDYKTMWSSAINRYSPRRECRSPSLPDVFNGQVKNTASETELNQMKDPTLYTTTNRETNPNLFLWKVLTWTHLPVLTFQTINSGCGTTFWCVSFLVFYLQEQCCPTPKDMHKLLDNNSNIVRDQPYEEETEMDSAAFYKMTASTVMNTSVYELCPPAVFDALDVAVHADGISTEELRRLDKTMAGCSLEDSFNQNSMVERLQQLPTDKMNMYSNPAYVSLATTLASEMPELNRQHNIVDDSDSGEDVIFKPQISQQTHQNYGYPQLNNAKVFMTTFDPKDKKTMSGMDPMSKCSNPTDVNQELEQLDCYEA
uniref:Uncharacterized protein n=1 Tax=Ditylenchus dipsaci TaxID=166011 RepID=A0A915EDT9_9BILA